ncbi:hypothetical protein AB0M58_27355 [Streptomyces bobili]|uniref:hypothetical protein n=1 Tax=Streptomyces bobili TaxID=67280 RepID=UPI00342DD2E9
MNRNQCILAICTLTAALFSAATTPALADHHVSTTPQDHHITVTPQDDYATVTLLDAHVTGTDGIGVLGWQLYGTYGPYDNSTEQNALLLKCAAAGAKGIAGGRWTDAVCTDDGRYVRLYVLV